MFIPTRRECLFLMEQIQMPGHIRKHSLMVAEIALYLSRLLNRNSTRLNLELVEAAALLHDIAKARSLHTGENHSELGASMLLEWGFPPLAPIVREHVSLDLQSLRGPVTESLVVNYADKRVKHDQVVTIEDRFHDLVERYGRTQDHRKWILQKLDVYRALERKIFDHLAISPSGVELMCLSVPGWPED